MEIVLLPKQLVSGFEQKEKPLNDRIIENCAQIRMLENLRDTLLPKLMSGAVRADYG